MKFKLLEIQISQKFKFNRKKVYKLINYKKTMEENNNKLKNKDKLNKKNKLNKMLKS